MELNPWIIDKQMETGRIKKSDAISLFIRLLTIYR